IARASVSSSLMRPPPSSALFPYTTLFRSPVARGACAFLREDLHAIAQLQLVGQRHDGAVDLRPHAVVAHLGVDGVGEIHGRRSGDRKSTRLNSSHVSISYAVFCLKKKSSQ